MYRTDFVKFEFDFTLHQEMRKSDSNMATMGHQGQKIGIICYLFTAFYLNEHVTMMFLQL